MLLTEELRQEREAETAVPHVQLKHLQSIARQSRARGPCPGVARKRCDLGAPGRPGCHADLLRGCFLLLPLAWPDARAFQPAAPDSVRPVFEAGKGG